MNYLVVFIQYLGKDQNIVQIYHDIFHYEVLKNIVYHSLEGGRIVSHIKEYYSRFKKATDYVESYFSLVTRLDVDIVKVLVYVQLSKVLGTLKFHYKLRD